MSELILFLFIIYFLIICVWIFHNWNERLEIVLFWYPHSIVKEIIYKINDKRKRILIYIISNLLFALPTMIVLFFVSLSLLGRALIESIKYIFRDRSLDE